MAKRHKEKGAWGKKADTRPRWEDRPRSKDLGLGMIDGQSGVGIKTSLTKEEESDLNHELTLLHQSYFGGKIGKDKTFQSIGLESPLALFQIFEKYRAARRARNKGDMAYHLSKLLGISERKPSTG